MKLALFSLGFFSLSHFAHAAEPRAVVGGEPNNGTIAGKVSCYSPPKSSPPGCASSMEGCNEVAVKALCPGMKPYNQAYQTPKNGVYIVAASGKFKKQVGMGAKVRIPGIPGIGIVCDVCPSCDKYKKLLDVASNNPAHRDGCGLTAKVKALGGKIEIVASKMKPGGK